MVPKSAKPRMQVVDIEGDGLCGYASLATGGPHRSDLSLCRHHWAGPMDLSTRCQKKKASQPWIEDVDFAGKVCDETGSHQKKKGSVAGVASKIKKTLTTEGSS